MKSGLLKTIALFTSIIFFYLVGCRRGKTVVQSAAWRCSGRQVHLPTLRVLLSCAASHAPSLHPSGSVSRAHIYPGPTPSRSLAVATCDRGILGADASSSFWSCVLAV